MYFLLRNKKRNDKQSASGILQQLSSFYTREFIGLFQNWLCHLVWLLLVQIYSQTDSLVHKSIKP